MTQTQTSSEQVENNDSAVTMVTQDQRETCTQLPTKIIYVTPKPASSEQVEQDTTPEMEPSEIHNELPAQIIYLTYTGS